MIEVDALSGQIFQLLQTDICSLFYRLAQELPGKQVLLNLGKEKLLVCQDSDSAQTILRGNPDNFHKNFGTFKTFFGSSRLTSDGEQWRKLQKISQPLIAGVDAAEIVRETKHHYAEAATRILVEARNGPVLAIDNFIDHAAASVVMKTVLGLDISALPSSFYANLRIVLAHCGKTSLNVYDPSLHADPAEKADVEQALGEARATINALIAEGRGASRGANSSLEAFYSAFPADSDLFGEFCTLLFAGYDTTSSTLCWALMLLANRPSLQEQLRNEVREAGEGKEDLSSSSRTMMALINETFRMFPAIPILSRVAVAEDHLGGTRVQAGQKVLLSIIGLHHDSAVWPRPSMMDIGRFPSGEPAGDKRKHLLPFSAGPRVCGGSKFAITEISAAIAVLLCHLRFEPADQQPVRFQWGASMRHKDGIRLVVASNVV